jgi:hypothetical protein
MTRSFPPNTSPETFLSFSGLSVRPLTLSNVELLDLEEAWAET